MAATKTKHKSATRKVTVRLAGWPARTSLLSVHDAYWYVALEFQREGSGLTQSLTYFETTDYAAALAKYNVLKAIVDED